MDPVLVDLASEHERLRSLLNSLNESQWKSPTRCQGWDVSDVVIHLAQTDEMAIASAFGEYEGFITRLSGEVGRGSGSVDEGASRMVAGERGMPTADVLSRWSSGSERLVQVLDDMDLSERVEWVSGPMSARTLTTTRLAETWIHSGDVAGAVGVLLEPTDALRNIARLAWRTLPYAFAKAGKDMAGPVEFRLTSPSGTDWDFLTDDPAVTTITGSAADLCDVASRRADPSDTSLQGSGPDADAVLALVRTYA